MNNVFIKFNFNEKNFSRKKKELQSLQMKIISQGQNVFFLKEFPPCLLSPQEKYCYEPIILSKDSVFVSNNLYFGDNYVPINGLFATSPFISEKCTYCTHFKSFRCRGLLNREFIKKETQLKYKLGIRAYNTIKSDYENGVFVFGSICLHRCKICHNDFFSEDILPTIPFLDVKTICHFLHFIPHKIDCIGSHLHCKRGEITDSPHFDSIIRILKHFINHSSTLLTRGLTLTKIQLQTLKKLNIQIVLDPIYSLDYNINKKQVKKKIDYLGIIEMLKKMRISYSANLFPIKSSAESRDIEKTISLLFNNDPSCSIKIFDSASMIPIKSAWANNNPNIMLELFFDYCKLKREISEKFGSRVTFIESEFQKEAIAFKRKINVFLDQRGQHYYQNIIMASESIYFQLSQTNSEGYFLAKIESSIGYVAIPPGKLLIKDFLSTLNTIHKKTNYVFIDKNNFDCNLDDLTLENVNVLWDKIRKITWNVVLI